MASGHVDTFANDGLPAAEAMPDALLVFPELQFPEGLNAATELLDRHVANGNGKRRAVLAPGIVWSYAELAERANRIARVLVEDLGVVPGNRVLLRSPNSPMLAACWLAVLKAGGIAVTSMPLYRATELRAIVAKAKVSHALCDVRLRDDLDAASEGRLRCLYFGSHDPEGLEARMASKSGKFENAVTAAEDIAMIAFTSGTTGQPKAAMHYHRDILATCETYGRYVLEPRADDVFCGSPPLAFTFGLGGLLLFPLHIGAATVLLEKAGPEDLLRAIETFGVTTIFTAPIAYRTMSGLVERFNIASLRTCVSAGEALPRAVWDAWHAATGLKILDGIGSTEMLHIFIGSPVAQIRPGATGRPVPGYVAEIHDEEGRTMPSGIVGRLAVKGPTGCKYLDEPRQSHYVQNGWNYPGDTYRRDDDGYFWYVARSDDMIVSAGYNISGPEVEQTLLLHPGVLECAVVSKPDPAHDTNIVKAFVVLSNAREAGDAKSQELREFCKAQIAPFKAPREIEFVTELPRTETGKLQRYRLRERAATGGTASPLP
jgi:2-aminobenzoate-CoA ligase